MIANPAFFWCIKPDSLFSQTGQAGKLTIQMTTVLKNFFKITFRNLWRSKGFSVINIAGLAIGMAAAVLILLWVQNEISTNRFFTHTDRLYQMYNRDKFGGETHAFMATPNVMAAALKQDYPETEDATRYSTITFLVSSGEKRFTLRGAFADSNFLHLFDFPLAKGRANRVLTSPY
ncbi:MAG TPA: ABC transporter permease, partial [Chitinophagaceae bacterium]|nr:ABC transporter permease [Chitinophagaceae bacterium]